MDKEEVKLCPFCGEKEKILILAEEILIAGNINTIHVVECRICFSRIGGESTRKKAIKRWNKRCK